MNQEQEQLSFPEGFVWGTATAAYQIEGAAREGGRGPSIWDTFSHTPGTIDGGDTGDVACDHYHRYPDDIALMASLGIPAYRFSVSWPRVQPDGAGRINRAGLDFYDRLVDCLGEHGIDPVVTLYHWDLPQALEERGGWAERETAYRFAEYAAAVHARLGDRVDTWTTLNEPWCSALLGYAAGVHAPGRRDPAAAFRAVHHLLLAHGLGVGVLREAGVRTVALTLNLADVVPADPDDPAELAAAHLVDGLQNRIFLDPVLRGAYPTDMQAHVERIAGLDHQRPGDDRIIAAPIDLLGVNYYNPVFVAARPGAPAHPNHPGADDVELLPAAGAVTAMGWPIQPSGLADLLRRIGGEYPGVPLLITENGAAFEDRVTGADRVSDPDRIGYLDGHLRACREAIADGVDLRGYFVWSLLDNFEWSFGYAKRFGIVHVDYATQRRVPKDSARWYASVVRANGLPARSLSTRVS